MKIAVTSTQDSIGSLVGQRFGRSQYFLIIETSGNEITKVEAVENQGAVQGHGAGIRAAEQLSELGVEKVITGQLGPNASMVLDKLGIEAYHGSGQAGDAVKKLLANSLEQISETAEPHSGMQSRQEKVFFPLTEDNGRESRISKHFGHAPYFGVYDNATDRLEITENRLDHADPEKSPIDQIEESVKPTTIFAKSIGGRAMGIIQKKGLCLKTGDYDTVGEAIENIDNLADQTESCSHNH